MTTFTVHFSLDSQLFHFLSDLRQRSRCQPIGTSRTPVIYELIFDYWFDFSVGIFDHQHTWPHACSSTNIIVSTRCHAFRLVSFSLMKPRSLIKVSFVVLHTVLLSYRKFLHLHVALFSDSATASSVTLTTEVIDDMSHEDSPFIRWLNQSDFYRSSFNHCLRRAQSLA